MLNRLVDLLPHTSNQNSGFRKSSNPFASVDLPQMIEPVEQMIVKNSTMALVIAFAVGVTIACLVKRR